MKPILLIISSFLVLIATQFQNVQSMATNNLTQEDRDYSEFMDEYLNFINNPINLAALEQGVQDSLNKTLANNNIIYEVLPSNVVITLHVTPVTCLMCNQLITMQANDFNSLKKEHVRNSIQEKIAKHIKYNHPYSLIPQHSLKNLDITYTTKCPFSSCTSEFQSSGPLSALSLLRSNLQKHLLRKHMLPDPIIKNYTNTFSNPIINLENQSK